MEEYYGYIGEHHVEEMDQENLRQEKGAEAQCMWEGCHPITGSKVVE